MAESKGAAARRINDSIRYMQISVFSVGSALDSRRCDLVDEVERDLGAVKGDLVTRGWYDVGGLRADADVMVWWHSDESETLQAAYHALRATAFGQSLRPVWSVQALHRPAEFNKSHVPAFLAGEAPGDYICVYPFVRSLDWYLLPDEQRRKMLADHGAAARGYKDVRANTVPAFALGDYEWILAFEAPELHRIVDLMRDLRATEARLHVREEIPFHTGPRVSVEELVARLP